MPGIHKNHLAAWAMIASSLVLLNGCEVGTATSPKQVYRAPNAGASGVSSAATSAEVGVALAVSVSVKDKSGYGIQNVVPTITAVDGTGSSTGITSNGCGATNNQGVASCALTSTRPGTFVVEVKSPVASTGNSVTFFQTPRAINVLTQPNLSLTVGALVTAAQLPVVQVVDRVNSPIPGAGTVLLTFNGVTISKAADAAGKVDFTTFGNPTGLTVPTVMGTGAMTLTLGAVTATTSAITINPGAASALSFKTQPPTSVATNVVFPTQPVVIETDQYGNSVTTDSSCVVSLSFTGGDNGDQLIGSTFTKTAVNGVADFTGDGLKIVRIGSTPGDLSTYRLHAAGTGVCAGATAADSNAFTVTLAGVPAQLSVTTPPGTAALNQVWPQQPVVKVLDENGQVVTSDNTTTIVMSITGGHGGVLLGSTSIPVTAGVANFSGLSIPASQSQSGFQGLYTYRFDAFNAPLHITPATGVTQLLTANGLVPAQLAWKVQPSSYQPLAASQPMGNITVMSEDANGYFDAFDNSTVVAIHGYYFSGGPGGGHFLCSGMLTNGAGDFVTTMVNGIATFTNCSFDTVGNYFFRAYQNGGGPVAFSDSSVFAISSFSNVPDHLAFIVEPNTTHTSAFVWDTQPVVAVKDAYGNTITSDNSTQITLSCALPIANCGLTGDSLSMTVSSGVASFTNMRIGVQAGAVTVQIEATASNSASGWTMANKTRFSTQFTENP
jgi:hypothetical protein